MNSKKDFSQISVLIIKYLENNLNDDEQIIFNDWLNNDSRNLELLESFKNSQKVQDELNFMASLDTEDDWKNLIESKSRNNTKKLWIKIACSIAASFLIIFGILFILNKKSEKIILSESSISTDIPPASQKAILKKADGSTIELRDTNLHFVEKDGTHIGIKDGKLVYEQDNSHNTSSSYNVLSTPMASYYHLILADGTKVWLNAQSSLTYPSSFNDKERVVELTGEAYFEIAKDKTKPFKVKFNNTIIEVLGTHFNINNYGNTSKTTLVEGSIVIELNKLRKTLTPGQQAISNNTTIDVNSVEIYKAISWKEGVFYFNNDDIQEITDQLSRWYNVDFTFANTKPIKKLTGSIRRQATLKQVLEMLNAASGASFTLNNKTITIKN